MAAIASEKTHTEKSRNFLDTVSNETGVSPLFVIYTFDIDLVTKSFAYSKVLPEDDPIIIAINTAPGNKIITEERKKFKNYAPDRIGIPLTTYFTTDNFKTSPVVQPEKDLIDASDYKIEEGCFFGIPDPSGIENPEGIFFLITRNPKETDMIQEKIDVLIAAL